MKQSVKKYIKVDPVQSLNSESPLAVDYNSNYYNNNASQASSTTTFYIHREQGVEGF